MQTAVIEGYAALFDRPDLAGDVIRRGAFGKPDPKDIRLLYQHKADEPVGRWRLMREDEKGLFVRGELLLETHNAREVWTLLRGGALKGLSIGFTPARARRRRTGRELTKIDLWEISIVTFPMMPGARITRVGPAQAPAEKIRHVTRLITTRSN